MCLLRMWRYHQPCNGGSHGFTKMWDAVYIMTPLHFPTPQSFYYWPVLEAAMKLSRFWGQWPLGGIGNWALRYFPVNARLRTGVANEEYAILTSSNSFTTDLLGRAPTLSQ